MTRDASLLDCTGELDGCCYQGLDIKSHVLTPFAISQSLYEDSVQRASAMHLLAATFAR